MNIFIKYGVLIIIGLMVTIFILAQPTEQNPLTGVFNDNANTFEKHRELSTKQWFVYWTYGLMTVLSLFSILFAWIIK